MRQRLIAGLMAVAIGLVGAVAFASPSNASTTFTGCQGPATEVQNKAAAESIVKDIDPAACLDIQFTDKCDGTTVVTMTNWAFNDNKFTVLTVDVDGKEYTLKGGSDPNTEVVTVGPKVDGLQVSLVFRFTAPDGSKITIVKPYGDPWTWEEPKGCVSPSPSATASASPSPSVSVSPSASASPGVVYANCDAAVAAGVAPINEGEPGYSTALDADGDGVACEDDAASLPVTGSANTWLISGAVLLFLVAGVGLYLRRRRSSEPVA
jgi:LPXTG-motif cell wall-anchored protein